MSVAFTLPGGIPIYSFSLLVGFASSFGMGWIALEAPKDRVRVALGAGFLTWIFSILGGRIGYLITHWGYYQFHAPEFIQLPLGGFSWAGAFIGMIIGMLFSVILMGLPFFVLMDLLFPLVGANLLALWMGCWLDGCGYGFPDQGALALPAVDEWGHLADRWPLQAVGGLLTLGTLIAVDRLRAPLNHKPGLAASLGWLALSVQLWWTSTLRADPAPLWSGMRLDTWAAIGLVILSSLLLLGAFLPRAASGPEQEKLIG